MLDWSIFVRTIAHRGLHDAATGREENTAAAFEAAIAGGYGIECDLRAAHGGRPVVFHDADLSRLTGVEGRMAECGEADLGRLRHLRDGAPILTFGELLSLVSGRVPLLVEVKSEWDPPDIAFLSQIARLCLDYRGPLALMSFDPDVMTVLRELATEIPRGIVSGSYTDGVGETWWRDRIDADRAARLANLLDSGPAAPSFFAYEASALPTAVTQYARAIHGLPLFAWTIRTQAERIAATNVSDAPIFEGFMP